MRHGSLLGALIAVLAGCSGGGGVVGDSCSDNGDCGSDLQCLNAVCVPRCQRAPECGDGYSCDEHGLCHLSTGQAGDRCTSEVDCGPGLSCQIDGTDTDAQGHLLASCTAENLGTDTMPAGHPSGSVCTFDSDCRNGTCDLGRCVDLCNDTRDCGSGQSCTAMPRVGPDVPLPSNHAPYMFTGCLQSHGSVVWNIPMTSPTADPLLLPIPDSARSVSVVMSVDDPNQAVGAAKVDAPDGTQLYAKPCPAGTINCTSDQSEDEYFMNATRHLPAPGQSVLAMPSSTQDLLQPGTYRVKVSSFRADGSTGSSIPHVTAVVKVDSGVILDLHFYFLDLDDHPCWTSFGAATLNASLAQVSDYFQTDFLGEIKAIFAPGGIALGNMTYEDITDHPDLDGLDVADAGSLLALGTHDTGINVFFVRTLSPAGLQSFGPNPGPAGLAGTRQSGIVIGVDTLCYRSWPQLARLASHALARYMGLYHNVELGFAMHPLWKDPIPDNDNIDTTDPEANLMYFSDPSVMDMLPVGVDLSSGQREILTRSAVLR
jgi:hypothetical protein